MKVPSNSVRTVRSYYTAQLEPLYGKRESGQMIHLLLAHYFRLDRVKIALQPELRLSESELLQLHFAVKDLLLHKPLQYVLGETEFCGRRFIVRPGVLIPRPETEQLITLIEQDATTQHPLVIMDIGTGSACIAVSLALAFPGAEVLAFDVSDDAMQLSQENATLNGAQIKFIKADLLSEMHLYTPFKADIIVSNPPYVRQSEQKLMRKNVTEWEPHEALFVSDDDPLIFYRALAQLASGNLKNEGSLWVEINEHLGNKVEALLASFGFSGIQCYQDFHGNDRFVRALKKD
ncbi:MAG: peptide chain release factor N(5)-glutamine methyltransferase [Bacteroidetes bacterium]|nr:peptide chain release factor N(5)-glutamine methyltransferase [Bacteroidota bacterium]MBU1579109.1 peptide chain release factor N(5)-glutamine methyltransferase [Bacteroidota bacterium]MBU2466817.1 peptide chain release factor N(5)-glutamine methyltransferase [Bacteroidota bacterium]MBU2558931.1 peptide chain release factor N(5)-glutamine methyltransferase [Bacteroidota bacterium]